MDVVVAVAVAVVTGMDAWWTPTASAGFATLAGTVDSAALGGPGAWPTLWLLCSYSAAALGASALLLHRHDV